MTRRAREIETLFLSMFAAVPLYLTYAIGRVPVILFHLAMGAIVLHVALGRGPELIPARVMRWLAIAYVPFYFIDWLGLSHSAMAASTHLVFFIAVYQPIESVQRDNHAQRLLTAALIFVASIATSTHITITFFVIAFALLMFRQLMYTSHIETARSVGRDYEEAPSGRAALGYVAAAALIASLLFPFLPRVRNPFVQGFAANLPGSTTGLSDTIDFRDPRTTPEDATLVARVWMDYRTRPFFTPLRLRGAVYDRFARGEWRQTLFGLRPLQANDGRYVIARRAGIERGAVVQQRTLRGKLFLPVGTYAVSDLSTLYEGGARESFFTYDRGLLNFEVRMSQQTEPLRITRMRTTGYPVTPEVAALARQIVGNEESPERRAQLIESWMLRNFRYVANPETTQAMTIEEFLLRTRAGHCEYFAAGMVVLLTALDVPARIAGGFYGGRLNPLTGAYMIRRDDAHAWTEVWDGGRWLTFDATPPSLRPGVESGGFVRVYLSAVTDSINYFWDRYILTFGLADQVELFTTVMTWMRDSVASLRASMMDDVRKLETRGFALILGILAAVAVLAYGIRRRRRPLFDLIAARLAAHGVDVTSSMTAEEALAELRARDPELATRLAPLIALYEEEEFSGRIDRERRRLLRRELRAIT